MDLKSTLNQLPLWYSKNKKPVHFIGKLIGLYLLFQMSYDYTLSPHTGVDHWLINSIVSASEKTLELLGYTLIASNEIYQYHLGIEGTSGVVIGNPCDGLSLFILYTAFILVFQGKWYTKLLFIIPGILLIHLLNVCRIVALALIVKYYPDTLDFHHSYTFTLFVYAFIFGLWAIRIKVFQKKNI